MELHELNHGQHAILTLRSVNPGESWGLLDEHARVWLSFNEAHGLYVLRAMVERELIEGEGGEEARAELIGVAVKGDTRKDHLELERVCAIRQENLCWILSVEGPRVTIQVQLFSHFVDLRDVVGEPLRVGLVEKSVRHSQLPSKVKGSIEEARRWFHREFVLSLKGEGYVFLSVGRDAELNLEGSFMLHGRNWRAVVRRQRRGALEVVEVPEVSDADLEEKRDPEDSEEHVLMLHRLVRGAEPRHDVPVILARGQVVFDDETRATKVRRIFDERLDAMKPGESFLKLWEYYVATETQSILKRAGDIGFLAYTKAESEGGRCCFVLTREASKVAAQLTERDTLIACPDCPDYLHELSEETALGALKLPRRHWEGRVKAVPRKDALTLVLEHRHGGPLPSKGGLVLSLSGDVTRLKRREDARNNIRAGRAPMLHLGPLLEGINFNDGRTTAHRPLTTAVRRKVFSHPPTDRQTEAIEVALNTPDIALIQGPPGTGKTTVIQAILERLHELAEDGEYRIGQFLVTSFQHDAVENVAERVTLRGLPTLKFGRRSSEGEDELQATERRAQAWALEIAGDLAREGVPLATISQRAKAIREVLRAYTKSPGAAKETALLLDGVANEVGSVLPDDLRDELHDLSSSLKRRAAEARRAHHRGAMLRRAVRALRVEEVSFADDGRARAAGLLAMARSRPNASDLLTEREQQMLQRVGAWRQPTASQLEALASLRSRLLLSLVPSPVALLPSRSNEVVTLLGEVASALERSETTTKEGQLSALADYRYSLENDLDVMLKAILENTEVFAATCQQAASQQLAAARNTTNVVYDTVIVDEAARCNPPDLLVPMAQARRKIILVGDHRQLPHMIEDSLAEKLERALIEGGEVGRHVKESLKESLFERLFERLKRIQGEGGARRVVTLDAQFRMHPALGDFVSQHFYGGQVRSPLEPGYFQHGLRGFSGRAAAWVDVPAKQGKTKRDGTSWARLVEAQRTVEQLQSLMNDPAGRDLSFGVITFYAAQVKAINEALVKNKVKRRVGRNAYELAEGISPLTRDGHERLRVGTVDAFQGREFDVVLLSVVRSSSGSARQSSARSLFGHLASPNRLCVSMSRQKKLLIVVGDRGLLRMPGASKAIGPLVGFHNELCRGDYGLAL